MHLIATARNKSINLKSSIKQLHKTDEPRKSCC